MKLIGPLI